MADNPFNNPFAKLNVRREELPEGPKPVETKLPAKGPAKAVVRFEKKGRGGKEVTCIEQLDLSLTEKQKWLKALKQSLGCGGTIEDDTLVLQGDHRERVEAWLLKQGVKRVSVG